MIFEFNYRFQSPYKLITPSGSAIKKVGLKETDKNTVLRQYIAYILQNIWQRDSFHYELINTAKINRLELRPGQMLVADKKVFFKLVQEH